MTDPAGRTALHPNRIHRQEHDMGRVSVDVVHEMIRAGNDTVEELVELSGWPRVNIEGAIRQLNMIISGDDKPIKRGQPASRPQPVALQRADAVDHEAVQEMRDLDAELDRIHEQDADAIEAELASIDPGRGDVRPSRSGPMTVITHQAVRPGPLVHAPTPLELLIEKAAKSPSKRTQALGSRIDDLCTELTGRLKEEATKELAEREERQRREKAKAEVERLEAQLRRAREAAGLATKKKTKTPKPKPEGFEPLPAAVPGESTSKIRSWAIEQGIDVGTAGRLPQLVVMQYRRAHQPAAAS